MMMATLGDGMSSSRDDLKGRHEVKRDKAIEVHWEAIRLVFVLLQMQVGMVRLCHQEGDADTNSGTQRIRHSPGAMRSP